LRRRTREVVLLFDGDEAGVRAVERALAVLLPEGLRVRAVVLPADTDPDSFVAREGAEALARLVDGAPAALDGVIRRAVGRGCATPWEKADAVAAVVPLLAQVPDPVERGELTRQLAFAADARLEDVAAALRRAARGADPGAALREQAPAPRSQPSGPEARYAERLTRLLIDHPAQAAHLDPAELEGLVSIAPWDRVLQELVAVARGGPLDLPALAERIGAGEVASALLAAAVAEIPPLEEVEAARAINDTLARLGELRRAEARRALTRSLAEDPKADVDGFLAAKQRQLEERRKALGLGPRPASRST
jgi:DNA primase